MCIYVIENILIEIILNYLNDTRVTCKNNLLGIQIKI